MKKSDEKTSWRRSRCDIRDEEDKIVLRLEMPGVNKAGLDIHIEGDKLIIDGRRTEDTFKGVWLTREIRPGNFHMEFTIDETVDRGAVDAVMNQGILELTLGLSESVKPRKISVVSK